MRPPLTKEPTNPVSKQLKAREKPAGEMMFVDVHGHAVRIPGFDRNGGYPFCTSEALIELHDKIGIERCVLLPMLNPECAYVVQSNEDVLEMAEKHPGRFIPFCNIDPRFITNAPDSPILEALQYYKAKGCKGVGEVCANIPFLDPLAQNLFAAAERVGFPMTFHVGARVGGIYGLYDEPGLPQLEECLRRFPELKFFGHSQSFWAEISALDSPNDRYGYPRYPVKTEGALVRMMRKYPNLHGDLSANSGYNALARDTEHAARFLEEFQDRLMYGTDICAPATPTPLAGFLIAMRNNGRISETVFSKVAGQNAMRILSL
jgi:uncharacterized protein